MSRSNARPWSLRREGPATAKRAQVQADVLRATEELLAGGSSYADLNVERIATAPDVQRSASRSTSMKSIA